MLALPMPLKEQVQTDHVVTPLRPSNVLVLELLRIAKLNWWRQSHVVAWSRAPLHVDIVRFVLLASGLHLEEQAIELRGLA